MNLSRRTLLATTAAVLVGACSEHATSTTAETTPAPTSGPLPSTPAPAPPPSTSGPTTAAPTTAPAAPLEYIGVADPFTLGVASGDPLVDSVILWTRLAPDPLGGGGLHETAHLVTWEMALDAEFTQPGVRTTREGTHRHTTGHQLAHNRPTEEPPAAGDQNRHAGPPFHSFGKRRSAQMASFSRKIFELCRTSIGNDG